MSENPLLDLSSTMETSNMFEIMENSSEALLFDSSSE